MGARDRIIALLGPSYRKRLREIGVGDYERFHRIVPQERTLDHIAIELGLHLENL